MSDEDIYAIPTPLAQEIERRCRDRGFEVNPTTITGHDAAAISCCGEPTLSERSPPPYDHLPACIYCSVCRRQTAFTWSDHPSYLTHGVYHRP